MKRKAVIVCLAGAIAASAVLAQYNAVGNTLLIIWGVVIVLLMK